MLKIIIATLMLVSLTFAESNKYEFTILGAHTKANDKTLIADQNSAGISFAMNLRSQYLDQLEFMYIKSNNVTYDNINKDTSIDRISINGIWDFKITRKQAFYGILGLGQEDLEVEANDNKTSLFADAGIGYKYKFSDHGILKIDLRHLQSLGDNEDNLQTTIGFAIPFGKRVKEAPRSRIVREVKEEVKEEPKVEEPEVVEEVVEEDRDKDKDGIDDDLDACPDSPPGAKVDAQGCVLSVDLNINFKSGSAKINKTYGNNLSDFAEYLKVQTKVLVIIEAHTDSIGSKKNNQKLSQRRADSAVKELVRLGIKKSRLKAVGIGETKPIATNMNKAGRAKNRRLSAVIVK